jgi:Ring finger domain
MLFDSSEDDDEVMTGSSCDHKFHKSCALLWLTNYKKPKDHCPYCRKEMMSAKEMKTAALKVLGQERVDELAQFPPLYNHTTTTLSPSQDSQDILSATPDIEEGTA